MDAFRKKISNDEERMLSIEEAEKRTTEAIDQLEDIINMIDHTPGKRDAGRRSHLFSLYMSLLAKRFGIRLSPSSSTGTEEI